jgi:hypothetical protein
LIAQILEELLRTSSDLARSVHQASPTFAHHARLLQCEDVAADTKEAYDLRPKERHHRHQPTSIRESEHKVAQQNWNDASKDSLPSGMDRKPYNGPGEHHDFFVPHFVIERGPITVQREAESAASRGARRME